jgi:RHS repeat-associated protein
LTTTSALGRASKDLWNGNIRHMVTAIQPFMASTGKPQARAYKYDQLNRIADAYTYNQVELDSNLWKYTGSANSDYEEHFTYDANGNIKTLTRNGTTADGGYLYMDDFTYNYTSGTNKLTHVDDTRGTGHYSDDIDDQSAGNYTYDAIGNMVSDAAEQIATVSWTVYGKIKNITRTGGSTKPALAYEYTPDGHRVSKKVTETNGNITYTYYIRDAQGNTMSTYTRYTQTDADDTFTWKEAHIYGSARLGVYNADKILVCNGTNTTNPLASNEYTNIRGKRNYELSNHLGNVLAVITDRRTGVCDDDEIESYDAEIIDATDYYAFGSPMPGRQGIQRCTTVSVLDTAIIYVVNEDFNSGGTGSFVVSSGVSSCVVSNPSGTFLRIESTASSRPSGTRVINVVNGKTYRIDFDLVNYTLISGRTVNIRGRLGSGTLNTYTSTGTKTFYYTATSTGAVNLVISMQVTFPAGSYTGFLQIDIDNVKVSYDSTYYANVTTCLLDKNGYRYGFNGMEKDNEHNVEGGNYDFGARIYDSRLGRWLSLDPMMDIFPFESPYDYCLDNPILQIDLGGNQPSAQPKPKPKPKQKVITAKFTLMELIKEINNYSTSMRLFKELNPNKNGIALNIHLKGKSFTGTPKDPPPGVKLVISINNAQDLKFGIVDLVWEMTNANNRKLFENNRLRAYNAEENFTKDMYVTEVLKIESNALFNKLEMLDELKLLDDKTLYKKYGIDETSVSLYKKLKANEITKDQFTNQIVDYMKKNYSTDANDGKGERPAVDVYGEEYEKTVKEGNEDRKKSNKNKGTSDSTSTNENNSQR